jgi:hypothetical protein
MVICKQRMPNDKLIHVNMCVYITKIKQFRLVITVETDRSIVQERASILIRKTLQCNCYIHYR